MAQTIPRQRVDLMVRIDGLNGVSEDAVFGTVD